MAEIILEVTDLVKTYGQFRAVDTISFSALWFFNKMFNKSKEVGQFARLEG